MPTGTERWRLLVVDGDEGCRRAMAALLEDDGYEVAVARDAPCAQALLSSFCPHLVVAEDVPSCAQVADITRHAWCGSCPLLLVTGPDRRLRRGEGAALRKPFDGETLSALVGRSLASLHAPAPPAGRHM